MSVEAIRTVAPEAERIVLSHPQNFRTVAEEAKHNRKFWEIYGALSEINPERSLIIGDFGLGSDSAIIIAPDPSIPDPIVHRLKWFGSGNVVENHWVVFFEQLSSFASFLEKNKNL